MLPPAAPCISLGVATGRMTLLLGPPSGGKTVLLQALSGRLRPSRNLRVRQGTLLQAACDVLPACVAGTGHQQLVHWPCAQH